ncbi:MAG TPA: TonB family protein, partial [Terriglobales bacterium]|nr:TonB family protein [Terriglobales bacterium]
MATIETPPKSIDPELPAARKRLVTSASRHVGMEEEDFHLLVSELRDDNSRSRLREAVWISIIVHMVVLFAIREAPRWLPARAIELISPAEQVAQNKDMTFLELPTDRQKVVQPPDTNKISDKDRIASARQPQLRKKDLQDLMDARKQGAPGVTAPPAPQQPPQQMAQNNAPPQQQSGQQQRPSANESSSVQTPAPPRGGAFNAGMSAGTAIQQAARASSQARGGGVGGDYGALPGSPNTSVRSDIDVLSDTMGVDFGPYLQRVLQSVRVNWYNIIPEVARPPLLKRGRVAIEFAINKDGSVAGMRLAGPSGDVSLDRAAWGGITASNPFPPLPAEFRGQYLALRFHFLYNPEKN